MFKKILYILSLLLIIFNLFIYNSSAEWNCESNCKIKNQTPEALLKYIENNKKIIQNISKNLWKQSKNINIPTNISTDLKNVNINNSVSTWMWLRIYNSLFNWNEAESWFKYFLANIDWDVPFPIKRDLQLIDNQNQALNYLLTKIIKNWYSSDKIDPKKICQWIDDNWKCEKNIWNDIEEALKKLINNNSTINLILRKELWFMWFKSLVWSSSYNDLFLVPENFKSEIQSNYNKETYKSCANCKWWSIYRIKKSIKNISKNFIDWNNWINEWKKAWNLLLWINNNKDEYNKLERNLLKKELARQGISTNNWEVVLKDLKDFQWNTFWFSPWNNPISNSFRNFIEAIKEPFRSKVITDFTEAIANLTPEKKKYKIDEITYSDKNLWSDKKIVQKIRETIQKNQAIIAKQNKNTWKLQWRILELHKNLEESINLLDKITIKTEKICNDQDYGNGKCSYKK